uniref:Glycosyltransferase 2-like domain-containing protein n=1 Tax=Tetraselmis sp. GSL018 TaxID=582737 RepID=A0A061S309_9CHLO
MLAELGLQAEPPADPPGRAAGCGAEPAPRWGLLVQYFRQPGNIGRVAAGIASALRGSGGGAEVVVVDDSKSEVDDWADALLQLSRDLPGLLLRGAFLILSNDIHEIRAYNAASRLSGARWLALLQDDDDPGARPDWLSAAEALAEAHPAIALLGGHRGRIDVARGGGAAPMDTKRQQADGLKFGEGHTSIPTFDPKTGEPFMFAYKVNAAPLIVRRRTLLETGGLHVGLSCPGEPGIGYDFELSVRMWDEGHKVGLFRAGFERLAHSKGPQLLRSGTRASKAKHKLRITNYHHNNAVLYTMYPGFHHEQGSILALQSTRALPRLKYAEPDILGR